MERRWTWQVAVVLLFAVALIAQSPATPAALNACDLGALLDLVPKDAVKFDRARVEQGYTTDIYALVQSLQSLGILLDLRGEATPEGRAKLHEIADRLDSHLRALLARRETTTRNADRDNLARYAPQDAVLKPPAEGEQRVLFMGDSITDGWRLQEYFIGKPYVNRGISGQITGEMLGRMKADVLDLKPVAMLVLAGTNDLARGVAVPVVENNLYMIASLAKAQGIKVILASILPVNFPNMIAARPPDKILEINKYIQDLCAKEGYLYLDYHSALKDDQGLFRKELANDGLHPNAEGYKIMAPLAQAAIDKALTAPGKAPARKK